MPTRRGALKWIGVTWIACLAWLGCNAILGNESAVFDPDAAAQLDATTGSDGPNDGTTTDGSLDGSGDAAACIGVDFDSSSASCGRCGHTCLGGECKAGVCQPVILATDVKGPRTLVRDGDFLYWINTATGDVMRVHADGGTKQLLYDGPNDTAGDSIAFTGANFYYATATLDGGIITCPKTGCSGTPTVVLSKLDVPGSVTIAASKLYFAETVNGGRIGSCALPCSSSIFLIVEASEGFPAHLSVEGAGIYWTTIVPSGVRGIEGLDPARSVSMAFAGEIVVLPGEVFWTEPGGGPRVAPRDGGPPRNLRTTDPSGTQSENLAVTNDGIYFTEPSRGTVFTCPRTGCPDSGPPLFKGNGTPHGVAADEGAIYWADEGTADGGGAIFRLAK